MPPCGFVDLQATRAKSLCVPVREVLDSLVSTGEVEPAGPPDDEASAKITFALDAALQLQLAAAPMS